MQSASPAMFDALVIGAGPAGISAALSLSRTLRTVAIFDSGLYRNANAVTFHTVPGEDGGDPQEWRTKAQEQLVRRYPNTCSLMKSRVVNLERIKPVQAHHTTRFAAKDDQGKTYEARKVVLAMGVEDKLTDIKGLQALWGRQAIHCVYCHGTETAGKGVGLLFPANTAINGMLGGMFFKKWQNLKNKPVYFLTNGRPADQSNGISDDVRKQAEKFGVTWVTDEIKELQAADTRAPVDISFVDESKASLSIPYLVTFAEQVRPSPHALKILESLGPEIGDVHPLFGVIPSPDFNDFKGPPAMNTYNPATNVDGVFWAGNTGNFIANVNIAVTNGQMAGVGADDSMAVEDLQAV